MEDTFGLPKLLIELLDEDTLGALVSLAKFGVSDPSDKSLIPLFNGVAVFTGAGVGPLCVGVVGVE